MSSPVDHPNVTATITRAASTTQKPDPNRVLRVWRANNYPKQMWYMLGIILFSLALIHAVRQIRVWYVARKYKSAPAGQGELATNVLSTRSTWTRYPSAVVNVSRIVLYRLTFPLGGGNVMNFAEVALVCGYITAVFLWEFLNSKHTVTPT